MKEISFTSTIICPNCGKETKENIPEDSCQYFWKCPHCDELLKPRKGDCCVFCSYGDNPCPPIQQEKDCC